MQRALNMSVMEGVILCVHLLILQQTVLPVTAQVTLQIELPIIEGSAAIINCLFTGAWNAASLRQWIGPGSVTIITSGTSSDAAKYTETIDSANNKFSMTIQNYNSGDEGSYQCQYGFDISNAIILSISNTEVHPSPPPLASVAIPDGTEAIDLIIYVPGIRPDASASFNLTSSTGTLKPAGTGSAVVTVTDDGNGRTSSSSLKIDVPAGTTSNGDIFIVVLVVGTYSETKQWTVAGGPATVHLTPSTTSYTPQEGQTLPTVTCSSDCNPVCSYSWTKDEQSHTTGSDIQLTNIQRGQTGVYRCMASNKYGNQTSSDVTVTVNYGPGNSISFQPNKDVLERVENQTVSDIVCFADCEPPCTYIWSNAGTTYPNPLSLSTAVRGNAGQYTCSASNSVGQGTKTWNLIVRCGRFGYIPVSDFNTNITNFPQTMSMLFQRQCSDRPFIVT